jgi:hypothetical protein
LREESRLRMYKNKVLRRILEPKRDEVKGSGENYIVRSLMICTPHQIIFGDQIEKNERGGACSTYRVRREVHTGF